MKKMFVFALLVAAALGACSKSKPAATTPPMTETTPTEGTETPTETPTEGTETPTEDPCAGQ